ncbi:hypothetical protein QUF54_11285, partial [Candidatus Marithioploca araucensis]|nr:hypothetical protein [Candidatus Marithioploca araucensis]
MKKNAASTRCMESTSLSCPSCPAHDVFPPHPKDTLHQSVLEVHEILFFLTVNPLQLIVLNDIFLFLTEN